MQLRLAGLLTVVAALVVPPVAGASAEIAIYRSHTEGLSVLLRTQGDHISFSKVIVRLPCTNGPGTTHDVYAYYGRPPIQIDHETGRFKSRNYFANFGRMRGRVRPGFIGGRFLGGGNPRLSECPTTAEDREHWLRFRAHRVS